MCHDCPNRELAPWIVHLQSPPSLANVLHISVISNNEGSLLTLSFYFSRGLPTGHLARHLPSSTFLSYLQLSIQSKIAAHFNLLNLIHFTTSSWSNNSRAVYYILVPNHVWPLHCLYIHFCNTLCFLIQITFFTYRFLYIHTYIYIYIYTYIHEWIPSGQTVNRQYYIEVLMKLLERVSRKLPELWRNWWILHQDNAPAQNALSVKQCLANKNITVLEHPP